MSEWTAGYRRALQDVARLGHSRGVISAPLRDLLADLEGDALVIEREEDHRLRRRRLTAAREALPLFERVRR